MELGPSSDMEMRRPAWLSLNWIGPVASWTSVGPAWSWIFNWTISSISSWSWSVCPSRSRICWTALVKPSRKALVPLRVVGPRLTRGTSTWMASSGQRQVTHTSGRWFINTFIKYRTYLGLFLKNRFVWFFFVSGQCVLADKVLLLHGLWDLIRLVLII